MHPRNLVLAALRVLAVYIGIRSIASLVGLGSMLASTVAPTFAGVILGVLGVLATLLPTVVAVALWLLAPWFSKLAIPESAVSDSTGGLSPQDLVHCGLIVVGALILVTALPKLVGQLLSLSGEYATTIPWVVASGLETLLAAGLLVGSGRLAGWATKLKYAGTAK